MEKFGVTREHLMLWIYLVMLVRKIKRVVNLAFKKLQIFNIVVHTHTVNILFTFCTSSIGLMISKKRLMKKLAT